MKYLSIISIFFLFLTGCTPKEVSLQDKVTELKILLKTQQDLNIEGENVTVALENDGETINFSFNNNILFDSNKFKVKSEFKDSLNIITDFLIKNPTFGVIVEGHTDSNGNKEYNQKLSEKRALAVTRILIEQGIQSERISSVGWGEEIPKVANDTKEGRNKNRRAEIRLKENIHDFVSSSTSSTKSVSKNIVNNTSNTYTNSSVKENDDEVPEGCEVAKTVSTVFTGLTIYANALVSFMQGNGILNGAKKGYDLANEERWIKGVKYICKD